MLLLIWSVYACFGIVSGSLAPISPLLITDLNFTYTQMGIILGFWQFIYIFTAMPTGNIIDKDLIIFFWEPQLFYYLLFIVLNY